MYMPPTDDERIAAIKAQFTLEGERLVRRDRARRGGHPWYVPHRPQKGVQGVRVVVTESPHRTFNSSYSRIKFLLLHGWLPEQVCHRDGDHMNSHSENLFPRDDPPGGVWLGPK